MVIHVVDSPSGLLKTWSTLVSSRCYPSLSSMISNGKNKGSFKTAAKKSVLVTQYVKMTDTCTNLPISSLPALLGRPLMLWSCCQLDRSLHGPSNFRIRLLVGCDGLELDASRFRYRNRGNISPGDASCKLCNTEEESPSHFLVSCPALSMRRLALLQDAPSCVSVHLPHDPRALHDTLYNLLQGLVWLKAAHAQEWLLLFIKDLRQTRADLLLTRTSV